MCKLCVNCQFTVNWWFTHRQRLSLHSRSLESYKADYLCKCGWIDIASANCQFCKLPVYMCKLHVNHWFTHVNQQFTYRQRLSLHSRSLESYKADYTCKCGWIDIASARASAIEVYTCKLVVSNAIEVYTCKLVVYMCKPQWQMLWQMLCQFIHIYTCNLPCTIPMIWNVRTVFACV